MADVPPFDASKPLFLFDGVCVLCSTGVRWLMRFDRKRRVNFASAQSPLGQALFAKFGISSDETYLLVEGDTALGKSDGYLRLCTILGGVWPLFRIVRIVPRALRDRLYDMVARNRYRWFGKADHCALLTEEQRRRLL